MRCLVEGSRSCHERLHLRGLGKKTASVHQSIFVVLLSWGRRRRGPSWCCCVRAVVVLGKKKKIEAKRGVAGGEEETEGVRAAWARGGLSRLT